MLSLDQLSQIVTLIEFDIKRKQEYLSIQPEKNTHNIDIAIGELEELRALKGAIKLEVVDVVNDNVGKQLADLFKTNKMSAVIKYKKLTGLCLMDSKKALEELVKNG